MAKKIGIIIAEDFSLTHFPRQVCQYLPRNGVTVSNDAASWKAKTFQIRVPQFPLLSQLCADQANNVASGIPVH